MTNEHKRRPHYSGKYPKHFNEKYKELNPEKYMSQQEHVINKGITPAGTHIPIMVDEILRFLQIKEGEKGIDCTLGYGGHTTKMLEKLDHTGHLVSLDVDPIEIKKTTERIRQKGFNEKEFTPVHINFRDIDKVAKEYGPFDFLLADLGVSSMQIDDPSRGFTWKEDGPLDLRFNPNKGKSAADLLKDIDPEVFINILYENSDEKYATDIAKELDKAQHLNRVPKTTKELCSLIGNALDKNKEIKSLTKDEKAELYRKTYARVFQALRIEVNQEFEVLYEFLNKLPLVMAPGGRIAILTFHSGEDRMVKKIFKEGKISHIYEDIEDIVIRPSKEECYRNPRAHSTKLRTAILVSNRE